ENLHPYCVKHNDPIMEYFPLAISCGAIQCRQDFISYYLPTKGCKYCFYGQSNNCDRKACLHSQVDYPKGCTYCRHPLTNGVQIFDCETHLKTLRESDK